LRRIVEPVERDLTLPQGEPAALAAIALVLEQPLRAREPSARHGRVGAHDQVVAAEPGGEPGRATGVAGLAIEQVGALLHLEATREVLEPAQCETEPLKGLRALFLGQRRLEGGPRLFPPATSQGLFANVRRASTHSAVKPNLAPPVASRVGSVRRDS
jgi:hypothetical protein